MHRMKRLPVNLLNTLMRNKRTLVILSILIVAAVTFVYQSFRSLNQQEENEGPRAFFTAQGNLSAPFNQFLTGQIKVLPEQQKIQIKINDSLVLESLNPTTFIPIHISVKGLPLGSYRLRVISYGSSGLSSEDERILYVVSDVVPQAWAIKSVRQYPHNDSSFTQGLCFYNGKMFEGTGDPKTIGATLVAEVELNTGKILKRRTKPQPIFGEGITVMNGELYQISWKNDSCFVYSAANLSPLRAYTYSGEGWGITHNQKLLIMSDGSEKIYFRDPKTFEVLKVISVFTHQGPVTYLNELEYVDGMLYANIWMSNIVAVIDPSTGRVIATVDATEIVKEGKGNGEVLNGIAYNPATKKTYLTGKYWSKLFEVKITPSKAL
jgi:glutamine cyclotransferase